MEFSMILLLKLNEFRSIFWMRPILSLVVICASKSFPRPYLTKRSLRTLAAFGLRERIVFDDSVVVWSRAESRNWTESLQPLI